MLWRRTFIGSLITAFIAALGWAFGKPARVSSGMTLRPPGALGEQAFLGECVRCLKCVSVCPNQCLDSFGFTDGLSKAFTPYLKARTRGCTLCGECADVCPTNALKPFHVSRDGWQAGVKMGTARVNKDLCFSYHGRTCGACYQACPLAGSAMKIGVFEQPIMQPENCVGCGLCEQACLHLPQAIRVIPNTLGKV